MDRCRFLIILLVIIAPFSNAEAVQNNQQPYFRVTYQVPKMPEGVYSEEAAAKNLKLYRQHLQKNKRIMAEKERQMKAREAFVNKHNEIAVNIFKDDRREYLRIKTSKCPHPLTVSILPSADLPDGRKLSGITLKTIDISRGGLGFYSSVLKINDEVPVKIKYGNTEVKTALRVVSSNNGRIGGKFVNMDETTSNKLIYLSSLLEGDSGFLKTKLSPM